MNWLPRKGIGPLRGVCTFSTQFILVGLDKSSAIWHTQCPENLMTTEEQMALDAHVNELSDKHRALEKQILYEMARPSADGLKLSRLKREKLQIKDEIEKLTHVSHVA
jgi:hypothetical protein